MSEREHERSVQLALRTDAELGKLFSRLGTRQAPRGRVLTAYRQARRTWGMLGKPAQDVIHNLVDNLPGLPQKETKR